MNITRIIKHLSTGRVAVYRHFSREGLDAIKKTIAEVEQTHAGQIRFAVEASLEMPKLFAGTSARQGAIEVFSKLRVWDTEHNNGVLIYLLLADRRVEIVADRGVHAKLGPAIWEAVCRDMETFFRQGRFEEGVIAGIRKVGAHLAKHYPHTGKKTNELADRPVIL